MHGKTYTGAADIPNPSDPDKPLGTAQYCLTVTEPKDDWKHYMKLNVDAIINDGSKHQCDYINRPVEALSVEGEPSACEYRYGTKPESAANWTHQCTGSASSEMLIGYGFINNYLQLLTIQGAVNGTATYFDSSKEWPDEMVLNATSPIPGISPLPNVTLSLGKCVDSQSSSSSGMSTAVIVVIVIAAVLVVAAGVGGYFWWKKKQESDALAASSYTPSLMSNQQHQQQNQVESQEHTNKGKWGV
jgi:hypothetical protein